MAESKSKIEGTYSIISKNDNSVIFTSSIKNWGTADTSGIREVYATHISEINNIKLRLDRALPYDEDSPVVGASCTLVNFITNESSEIPISQSSPYTIANDIEWQVNLTEDKYQRVIELRVCLTKEDGTLCTLPIAIDVFPNQTNIINLHSGETTKRAVCPTLDELKSKIRGLEDAPNDSIVDVMTGLDIGDIFEDFDLVTTEIVLFDICVDYYGGSKDDGIRYKHCIGWIKADGTIEYYPEVLSYTNSRDMNIYPFYGLQHQRVFGIGTDSDFFREDGSYEYYKVTNNGIVKVDIPKFVDICEMFADEITLRTDNYNNFVHDGIVVDDNGFVHIIDFTAEGNISRTEKTAENGEIDVIIGGSNEYMVYITNKDGTWRWCYVLDEDGNRLDEKNSVGWVRGDWEILDWATSFFAVADDGSEVYITLYKENEQKDTFFAYTKGSTSEDFQNNWWSYANYLYEWDSTAEQLESRAESIALKKYPNDAEKCTQLKKMLLNFNMAGHFGYYVDKMRTFYPNGDCALMGYVSMEDENGVTKKYIKLVDETNLSLIEIPQSPLCSIDEFMTYGYIWSDQAILNNRFIAISVLNKDVDGCYPFMEVIVVDRENLTAQNFIINVSIRRTFCVTNRHYEIFMTESGVMIMGSDFDGYGDGDYEGFDLYSQHVNVLDLIEPSTPLERVECSYSIIDKQSFEPIFSDRHNYIEGYGIYATNKKDINDIMFRIDEIHLYPLDAEVSSIECKVINNIDFSEKTTYLDTSYLYNYSPIMWDNITLDNNEEYTRCLTVQITVRDKQGNNVVVQEHIDAYRDVRFKTFNVSFGGLNQYEIRTSMEILRREVKGMDSLSEDAYIEEVLNGGELGFLIQFKTTFDDIRYFHVNIHDPSNEKTVGTSWHGKWYAFVVGWVYSDGTIEYYPEIISQGVSSYFCSFIYNGLPHQRVLGIPKYNYQFANKSYNYYKLTDKGLVKMDVPSFVELAEIFKNEITISTYDDQDNFLYQSIFQDNNGFFHILCFTAEGSLDYDEEQYFFDEEPIQVVTGSEENLIYITNKDNEWKWCYVLNGDGNKIERKDSSGWLLYRDYNGTDYSNNNFAIADDGSEVYIVFGRDDYENFYKVGYTKGSTSQEFSKNWWEMAIAYQGDEDDTSPIDAETMRAFPNDENKRRLYKQILLSDNILSQFGYGYDRFCAFYPNGDCAIVGLSYLIDDKGVEIPHLRPYDGKYITLIECNVHIEQRWGGITNASYVQAINDDYLAIALIRPDYDLLELYTEIVILDRKKDKIKRIIINESVKNTLLGKEDLFVHSGGTLCTPYYVFSSINVVGEVVDKKEINDTVLFYETKFNLIDIINQFGEDEDPGNIYNVYIGNTRIKRIYVGSKYMGEVRLI